MKYLLGEEELIDLLKRYEHNKGFFDELIPVTLVNFLKTKQPVEVIAKGEVLHINDKFYLGHKIENRIEELEALEECFYKKLPEGKNVEIAFSEVAE